MLIMENKRLCSNYDTIPIQILEQNLVHHQKMQLENAKYFSSHKDDLCLFRAE